MTDVPAEVVARGRAIFDRLRGTAAPGATDTGPGDPADEAVDASAEDAPAPTQAPAADDAVAVVDVDHADEPAPTLDPAEPVTGPVDGAAPSDEAAEATLGGTAPPDPAADVAPAPPEPSSAPAPTPSEPQPATNHSVGDEIGLGSEVPAVEALVTVPEVADPTAHAEPSVVAAPPSPDPPTPDARRSPADSTGDAGSEGSRFARPLPRVIAVANQKGGVGKTTTTVNLAACLADLGYRVLIVDLDPQGNASTGVGINIRDLANSMYDVLLRDAPMEDCIEATSVRNLYVAPANLELAGAEIELVPAFSRELKLRAAIDSIRDDYDFVFVDCPPSLGLLTVNSLAAASEVLVPIQCEYYALEGLGQLLRNVGLVQKNLNPTLEVSVIVCVMYDARTKLADQVVAEVRAHFGEKVCRTVVPRTVRLSEAPSYGQPISAFDPSSRGAIAYKELAKEVGGGTPQRVG